jgi:GT2 family glycosyltransferase
MLTIVIPVHNRRQLTRTCLESLGNQIDRDFNIIVVDDGSTDGTFEMLAGEFPEVTVLKGDGNLWWTGAVNLGVQHVLERCDPNDIILLMNNDTVAADGFFRTILESAAHRPNALIGSVALDIEDRERIVGGGVSINWWNAKYTSYNYRARYSEELSRSQGLKRVSALPGRGTLVPVKVFQRIGLFDERRLPHYGADYEFSCRADRMGYELLVDYGAIIYSHVSLTGLNNQDKTLTWSDLVKSFFSIRSPNCLKYRWNFARLTRPLFQAFVFFFFDLVRLIGGTLRNQVFSKKLP